MFGIIIQNNGYRFYKKILVIVLAMLLIVLNGCSKGKKSNILESDTVSESNANILYTSLPNYTDEEKLVLMCAANRRDIGKIKMITRKIDPNSFIIITNSREVLGLGFKKH